MYSDSSDGTIDETGDFGTLLFSATSIASSLGLLGRCSHDQNDSCVALLIGVPFFSFNSLLGWISFYYLYTCGGLFAVSINPVVIFHSIPWVPDQSARVSTLPISVAEQDTASFDASNRVSALPNQISTSPSTGPA